MGKGRHGRQQCNLDYNGWKLLVSVWTVLLQWSLSTDRSDCPHWFMTEPPHASGSEAANVL